MRNDPGRRTAQGDEDGDDGSSIDTRLIWAGLFFALAIFSKAPGLDLLVSANYYNAESGFFHRDAPMVRMLYEWTPPIGRGLIVVLVVYAIAAPWIARWFQGRGREELAQRCAGPLRRGAVLARPRGPHLG